jgi:hypothetical protein
MLSVLQPDCLEMQLSQNSRFLCNFVNDHYTKLCESPPNGLIDIRYQTNVVSLQAVLSYFARSAYNMGRIPSSWACQKEPRSSNSFMRVKTGIAVNAAVLTEAFLPLFAAVSFRLNMDNDRIGQAQGSHPTTVCGRRPDVLAGVTKHSALSCV